MTQAQDIPQTLDNGERMIPDLHRGAIVYVEHIVRYLFAGPLVRGKTVLDVAAGSGYGSEVLREAGARSVVGLDLEVEAVRYAERRYSASRPAYVAGDAEKLPFGEARFEVVVSFETIEHLPDPFAFLREVRRVLVPGGLFIVSTPNKGVFVEGNPFHVHEFTFDELEAALNDNFKNTRPYLQNDWIASAIMTPATTGMEGKVADVPAEKVASLKPNETLYVLSLCSDGPLPEAGELMSLGHAYEMRGFMSEVESLNAEIERLRKLWDVIAEKEQHIQNFIQITSEKDGHIQALQASVAERDEQIAALRPLATLRRVVTAPVRAVRGKGSSNNRRAKR